MLTSSNRLIPSHQPLHIHAHSTIDTWQSKMDVSQRAESVPTIIPEQLYFEPRSRIDTWQKRRARSASNIPSVCKSKMITIYF